MSGGSKAQTIGYKYYIGLHMGWCHGPVDALLEIRAGDRTVWQGEQSASGQISFNKPSLFGGDEREGGIVGTADVMMGESDQAPNSYLASKIGTGRPAYRGILGLVFRGGHITSNNPYIKPWAAKVRRILEGWKGGSAWYPEKAEIGGVDLLAIDATGWEYQIIAHHSDPGYSNLTIPTSGWTSGQAPFGSGVGIPATNSPWTIKNILWARRTVSVPAGTPYKLRVEAENGCVIFVNGAYAGELNRTNIQSETLLSLDIEVQGPSVEIAIKAFDEVSPAGGGTYLSARIFVDVVAMNPAHIIYECLTNEEWGMGYDSSILDADSFEAAADTFYNEGLGLCLQWARQDSIESFIQLVCNHAGAVCVQDPRSELIKLTAIRGDYDIETLPVFSDTAGNVISMERMERATVTDTVNEITVSYVDSATGKPGSVTVQNLAAIQAAGRVISQSVDYPGIPTAQLALRIAMRDLRSKTAGIARHRLTVTRAGYDLLPGGVFAFSWAPDGIVQMALRVVDIDYGSLVEGRIGLECAEDVFGLPDTTYAQPEHGGWESPDTAAQASEAVAVFEAPYRELIQTIGRGETQALTDEAGYLAAIAARPSGFSVNYALYTRTGADAYEETSNGDWCPTGTLDAAIGPTATAIVMSDASDLDQVDVGTTAMLGSGADAEIVRVDAVDSGTGSVTIARGCLDTVPAPWPAGTRFWAYDQFSAGSVTEYADGETVDAQMRTRTTNDVLAEDASPEASLTINQRQARPYPPGLFRINSEAYPEYLFGELTVTWAHRDRLLQDDQVIDADEASIGPEAGTTYNARFYLDDVLVESQTGITDTDAIYLPLANGLCRVELEAARDGITSWQMHSHEFDFTTAEVSVLGAENGDELTTEAGDLITTE